MSIVSSELKFYKAAGTSDTVPADNGGLMSADVITSGELQNVFPHALAAERDSGSVKKRKIFCKVADSENLSLIDPKLWLDVVTDGEDWVTLMAGTQVDTEATMGSPRIYGCSSLKTNVSIGGGSLVVTVEDDTIAGMFVDGDTIRITDMVDPDSGTGNEEFHVINGAPSVSGDEVTITLTGILTYGYLVAADTRVMSVIKPADVKCLVDNWVESGAGAYDEGNYPVVCSNIGTIEQEWTIDFTDGTTFTVTGDTVGALDSGTVGSDYSYENPDFPGSDYFTLESGGWDGNQDATSGLVFKTHPAASPVWEEREIPAGAVSVSTNKTVLAISGETA